MKEAYGIFRTSNGFEVWKGVINKFSDTGIEVEYNQLRMPYKYKRNSIGKIVFTEQQDAEIKRQEMQSELEEQQYGDAIRDET